VSDIEKLIEDYRSDPYKEQELQRKQFKKREAARNKRFNEEVKEVMEGLGVSKEEAEKIVEEKDMRPLKRKSKKKKNFINVKNGGKVYARGSRKANYNG
jgi:3-methyladenine DNA glycosylase AlkD